MASPTLGFFLGGVRDQENKNRELALRESQVELARQQSMATQITDQVNQLTEQAAKIKAAGKWTPQLEQVFMEAATVATKNAQMAGLNIDAVGALKRTVSGTPTPIEAAQVEGASGAVKSVSEATALETQGVPSDVARAKTGLNTAEPKVQNFMLPDGSTVGVDTAAPDAREQVDDLIKRGAVRIGLSVQGQSLSDLGMSKKDVSDYFNARTTTRNAISEIGRLKQQVSDGTFTGLAGGLIRGLSNVAGNMVQLAKASGFDDQGLLDPQKYKLDGFGADAASSAAFRRNAINLAYVMARAADPGGRLSDRDVQAQLDSLALNAGDQGQLLAALDEAERSVRQSFQNTHLTFSERGVGVGEIPEDLQMEAKPEPQDMEIPAKVQRLIDNPELVTKESLADLSTEELQILNRELNGGTAN